MPLRIHGRTIRATRPWVHVHKKALLAQRACDHIQVKSPNFLHRGMRVRQVQNSAIGAHAQAIGREQARDVWPRQATLVQAIKPALRRSQRHVHHHGAHPQTPTGIAAAVIEAHARCGMGDACQPLHVCLGTFMQGDARNAGFHGRDQLALNASQGNATHALRHAPRLHRLQRARLAATNEGAFNVHPPQTLRTDIPHRGLPHTVLCIGNGLTRGHERVAINVGVLIHCYESTVICCRTS